MNICCTKVSVLHKNTNVNNLFISLNLSEITLEPISMQVYEFLALIDSFAFWRSLDEKRQLTRNLHFNRKFQRYHFLTLLKLSQDFGFLFVSNLLCCCLIVLGIVGDSANSYYLTAPFGDRLLLLKRLVAGFQSNILLDVRKDISFLDKSILKN